MSGDASDDLDMQKGESRVRARTRVPRQGDTIRAAGDPLRSALRETERRFLASQASAAARGSPTVLSEYLTLMAELGVIDEQLEEASARRDNSYLSDRRLNAQRDYCRWLARRVSTEFLLLLEVHLEQELKRLIAPDAYELFLRFEKIEDAAREIETLPDNDLMARVREGTVFRQILKQVRVWDLPARPQELSNKP
jgi:hypothetical protein